MATHVERVVAFGDSIMQGMGAKNHYGWAQMLERHYYELNTDQELGRHAVAFYNLAVPGCRAVDLAPRVQSELESRIADFSGDLLPPDKVLSIVSLGDNDAWLRHKQGTPKVSEDEFAEHMGTIAQILAARSRTLFVGPISVDETKNRTFHNLPTRPQFESLQRYEAIAIRIFQQVGGRAVEIATATQYEADFFDHLREDGAHPDDKGHEWICHQVHPWFDAMVGGCP